MGSLLDQFGRPIAAQRAALSPRAATTLPRKSRSADALDATHDLFASYDSAKTTDDNSRHWAKADTLSAAAAADPQVRRTLRSRARYEAQENNSYAKGIVLTLANDVIGTGPRLEMMLPDQQANRRIERSFSRWARAVRLAAKLRTMRLARAVDGEAFALFVNNPRLPTLVQLDLRLVEAEQIATPTFEWTREREAVDGIRFDAAGNPTEYHVLKDHPGAMWALGSLDFDRVPAEQVIHLFRCDRPGQRRGISEIAPALPLFAQLRRFTLATLDAAEAAARIPFWVYTDARPDDSVADVAPLESIDLERNMATTMPHGWKVGQMDSKHPATTYEMFKRELLREIGRVVLMPYNLSAGDSSSYNYASGRLDHQTYFRALEIDRADLAIDCLDRILTAWFDEAVLTGEIPEDLGPLDELPHRWGWNRHPHVDPLKEANATTTLWEQGHLSDDDIQYLRDVDPDEHYARLEQQMRRRRALGLPLPGQQGQGQRQPAADSDGRSAVAEDDEEEAAGREADDA